MIIVTATMWPHGNQSLSYELLNATITNQSSQGDAKDSYFAHVLSRPHEGLGVEGFEADVEVRDHERATGLSPLLMAILAAAAEGHNDNGIFIPPARTLARLSLRDAFEFEARRKARQ